MTEKEQTENPIRGPGSAVPPTVIVQYIEVRCPRCGRRVKMQDLPPTAKCAFLIDCTACHRKALS